MTQYFNIHPENPQQRLLDQTADMLRQGRLSPCQPTHVIHWPVISGMPLPSIRSARSVALMITT